MEVELIERMLRALPGVLDCSVNDEGIAIVVHPEVDPRMMELRARDALAEVGDDRPLLVVGGMSTTGGAGMGPGRRARPPYRGHRNRSSMPVIGFAVLIVAALTIVPLAGRDVSSRRDAGPGAGGQVAAPSPAAPGRSPSAAGPTQPSFGSLPIVDEGVAAVLAPTFVGPVGALTSAARVVGGVAPDRAPPPAIAVEAGTAVPAVPSIAADNADDGAGGTSKGKGEGTKAGISTAGADTADRMDKGDKPPKVGKAHKADKANKAGHGPKAGKAAKAHGRPGHGPR